MPRKEVLESIDEFIDARSSLDIPGDEAVRIGLYHALVKRVSDDWAEYMKFYQTIFDNLKNEYSRGLLNSKASKLQEMCTQVVSELEAVEGQEYSQVALFQAKELVINFRGAMDIFKEEIKAEFAAS